MPVSNRRGGADAIESAQGHAIGFVDSRADSEAIIEEFHRAGIADSRIVLFSGEEGKRRLKQLMAGSWGEAEEHFLSDGISELNHEHAAIAVEVKDLDEARQIAKLAARHGGHTFTHFGTFVDTGLPT